MTKLCLECHEMRDEIAYVDALGRGYCVECMVSGAYPIGSVSRAMGFASATIPFQQGDRVGAFGAGGKFYDRTGIVVDVDLDIRKGCPAAPTFRVEIDRPADLDAPADAWYAEQQLVEVGAAWTQ